MANGNDKACGLSELEQRVLDKWYKGKASAAFARGMSLGQPGRFYVVQGGYSQRTTRSINETLQLYVQRGMQRCASALSLGRELSRRGKGIYRSTPTDPNGPAAA